MVVMGMAPPVAAMPATGPAEAVVAIRGLRVRYGHIEAVCGLDLEIRRGETFGLLGPNGAGKTTTLACIEGLRAPDVGSVRVFGEETARSAAAKGRIGVSLQHTALFPFLTARELLEMYAAMYDRYPTRADLDRLLDRFDLAEKAGAQASELSGGQQQRLALAIALVNDPELVILDEPTTGLDPQARRRVWELITGLRAEGRTILLTTHAMEEAEALCGRVGIMDHGEILALDSPTTLVRGLGAGATVLATVELPLDAVHALPGVTGAQYVGERLEIRTADAQMTLGALYLLASERGRAVRDATVREPNLEDVFIALTGRTIRS